MPDSAVTEVWRSGIWDNAAVDAYSLGNRAFTEEWRVGGCGDRLTPADPHRNESSHAGVKRRAVALGHAPN